MVKRSFPCGVVVSIQSDSFKDLMSAPTLCILSTISNKSLTDLLSRDSSNNYNIPLSKSIHHSVQLFAVSFSPRNLFFINPLATKLFQLVNLP